MGEALRGEELVDLLERWLRITHWLMRRMAAPARLPVSRLCQRSSKRPAGGARQHRAEPRHAVAIACFCFGPSYGDTRRFPPCRRRSGSSAAVRACRCRRSRPGGPPNSPQCAGEPRRRGRRNCTPIPGGLPPDAPLGVIQTTRPARGSPRGSCIRAEQDEYLFAKAIAASRRNEQTAVDEERHMRRPQRVGIVHRYRQQTGVLIFVRHGFATLQVQRRKQTMRDVRPATEGNPRP